MRQNIPSPASGLEHDRRDGTGAVNKTARTRRLGGLAALATFVVVTASAASAQNAGTALTGPAESSGDAPAVLAMNEAGEALQVTVGHSKLLQAGEPLGTIIVGDDTIAAATIGAGNSIILTGLAAGSTNLIVLSEDDEMLMASQVQVVPVAGRLRSTVTLLKGASTREQYECRGNNCEPVSAEDATTEMPLVLMAAPSQAVEPSPAD